MSHMVKHQITIILLSYYYHITIILLSDYYQITITLLSYYCIYSGTEESRETKEAKPKEDPSFLSEPSQHDLAAAILHVMSKTFS